MSGSGSRTPRQMAMYSSLSAGGRGGKGLGVEWRASSLTCERVLSSWEGLVTVG